MGLFKDLVTGRINVLDVMSNTSVVHSIKEQMYLEGLIEERPISEKKVAVKPTKSHIEPKKKAIKTKHQDEVETAKKQDTVEVAKIEKKRELDAMSLSSIEKALNDIGIKSGIEFEHKVSSRFDIVSVFFSDYREEELYIKKYKGFVRRLEHHNRGRYIKVDNKKIYIEKETRGMLHKENYKNLCKKDLDFVVEVDGRMKVIDFSKIGRACIVGTSGSGKSVFQNSVIYFWNSPLLFGIVPKVDNDGNDLRILGSKFDNLLISAGMEDYEFIEQSLNIINYIHETMKSRELKISKGERFTDDDNIVLVIDEVADLIQTSSIEREETANHRAKIIELLNKIARKGRSSRIFMLLATQYAKVSVLGHLKSNMELLALRVLTEGDEKSIGLPCKDLLGSGDGRMAYNGSLIRFQSCF